jgi:hypothetical protein
MKKILLQSVLFLSVLVAASCSSEENTTDFNDAAVNTASEDINGLAAKSSIWDGEIGVDDKGTFVITANESILLADMQDVLKKQGNPAILETIEIVEKIVINNPSEKGYMIVASDKVGTSVGVPLLKSTNIFRLDRTFRNATTCTGCAQGCNLSYLNIDGKRIPYCNENGCTYNCTKGETSF